MLISIKNEVYVRYSIKTMFFYHNLKTYNQVKLKKKHGQKSQKKKKNKSGKRKQNITIK